MARYIDAEKFEKDIIGKAKVLNDEIVFESNFVYSTLYQQPTADVVEVKNGMWINTDSFDTNYQPIYQCSVCNKEIADEFVSCHKYCLHCGAKMDKRSEGK